MVERSWRWLRSRIVSLLDRPPSFLQIEVSKDDKQMRRLVAVPSTRLGYVLSPPNFTADE